MSTTAKNAAPARLPPRQKQALHFLRRHLAEHGRPPELWEFDEALGCDGNSRSRCSTSARTLAALRRRGLVAWDGDDLRTLVPTAAGLLALAGGQA